MGLYTRKDYERDCKNIDAQIAKSATLLGMQLIGPLDHWQRATRLDETKRKLGQKLAMTALALADKSKMERSKRFAWVIGAKKVHEDGCPQLKDKYVYCNCYGEWYVSRKQEPLLKHGQPHYRETTLREIYELQSDGVTVMESGFPMRKKGANAKLPVEEGFKGFVWIEVPEKESIEYQNQGEYYKGKDGKQYWAAHYMVKSEGEGPQRKFYITDVR